MSETRKGELRVTQRISDYEFGVELWVMREGVNNNRWDYRNLEEHYRTFAGTPILCAYVGGEVGDGHNMREKRDLETGERYYSFTDGTAERIVGTISDDVKDLSLRESGGYKWLVAKGRLGSFYAPELVEKIVRTGRMDVSAETEVRDGHRDGEVEVFESWIGLGVTVLGDRVEPAIPGARIAALAALQGEFDELKLRVAAYQQPQEETKQKEVKKKMDEQAVKNLSGKFGAGYRIIGLSEDGMRAALLAADGGTYSYTFNEGEEDVDKERIMPAKLNAAVAFDGADALDVEIGEHIRTMAGEKADLTGELAKASAAIAALEETAHALRLQAVKDAIHKTMADICAASEDGEDVSEEAADVEANAEEYAGMEREGAFCGAEEASRALKAKWTEKLLARASEKKKGVSWKENSGERQTTGGGIEEMLAYINK